MNKMQKGEWHQLTYSKIKPDICNKKEIQQNVQHSFKRRQIRFESNSYRKKDGRMNTA